MKNRMIIHMIAGLSYAGGAIWGIIEGVDYFVNQDSVNWNFLFPLVIGLVVAMSNMIAMMKD